MNLRILLVVALISPVAQALETAPDAGVRRTAVVDGKTGHLEVESEPGNGRWGVWVTTDWLVYADGTRRVGLRMSGRVTAFVVDKDATPPSRAEMSQLLAWEDFRLRDPKNAGDQLASGPPLEFVRRNPDAQLTEPDEPTVSLIAGMEIRALPSSHKLAPQGASWQELSDPSPPFEYSGGQSLSCPCYSLYSGEGFKDATPKGARGWKLFTDRSRNPSFALAVEAGRGKFRWFGDHYGPLEWIGTVRGRAWFYARYPLEEAVGVLFELHPAAGTVEIPRPERSVRRRDSRDGQGNHRPPLERPGPEHPRTDPFVEDRRDRAEDG